MPVHHYTIDANPPPSGVSALAIQAMRMALRYTHRNPTVAELRQAYGMSRATAYRWIAAFKAAKGEA